MINYNEITGAWFQIGVMSFNRISDTKMSLFFNGKIMLFQGDHFKKLSFVSETPTLHCVYTWDIKCLIITIEIAALFKTIKIDNIENL